MKKLGHEELRAARDRDDWNTLWLQAIPLVKFCIKQMMAKGEVDLFWAREDLLQEGMLAAGFAVRSWDTIEGAFSTWVCSQVRYALLNYCRSENNGMVGGRDAYMLRLDMSEIVAPVEDDFSVASYGGGRHLDEQNPAARGGALTYGGVVMGSATWNLQNSYGVDGGRVSKYGGTGAGETPAGFGNPEYEASLLELRRLVTTLPAQQQEVISIWIAGDFKRAALKAYAEARDVSLVTAYRRLNEALDILRQKLGFSGESK